ncbi:MAG: Fe-S cluster assembly protein SufD [Steroidobacteraceae bacterium]
MTAASAIDRIAATHARLAPLLPGGPEWAHRRGRALATLVGRGLPDRRDENWKYLDHARLAGYEFGVVARPAVDPAALAAARLPLEGACRLVIVDGRFDAALSGGEPLAGVTHEDIGALLGREPAAAHELLRLPADDADDRFAVMADAFTDGGVVIRIAAGSSSPRPLHLLHVASAMRPAAHHARLVIAVGAGAKLVLVEEFLSLGDAAVFANLAAELAIGAAADVEHLRLHRRNPEAVQVETWDARLGAGGSYRQHLVALGGGIIRSNFRLALAGEGAACRLAGLFLADGKRQVDIHTQVEHCAPRTRTEQDFRGIATGRGRGAINGRIVMRPAARGADANQSIRNLLLSPLAEINARPQLEIHVDDVRCRHGATTGTLDPAQLFYLRSRGLDEATARNLLTFAFCQDVLAGMPLPVVRDFVATRVADILPDVELMREQA